MSDGRGTAPDASPRRPPDRERLRERVGTRIRAEMHHRLSPEKTRDATLLERMTVSRLSEASVVRLNRWLELTGKLTSGLWAVFFLTVVLGVEWKDVVQEWFNSGKPVEGAIVLVFLLPTLLFVALHSVIGFARWRLQRELWRRDVARVSGDMPGEPARGGGDADPPRGTS